MIKYIGMTNDKRFFKVSKANVGIIPKGWRIFYNKANRFYNRKTTKIVPTYEGVKELKTPQDVEKFKAINEHNIDVLFGYFKKMIDYEQQGE